MSYIKRKIHLWFWTKIASLSCYLENKSWKELCRHREFRKQYKDETI